MHRPQDVTVASIAFDDLAVADFFETQVDAGRKPEQFGRIWLHTHPGNSAQPSGTDEETFYRVFGHCQWAVHVYPCPQRPVLCPAPI